MVKIYSTTYINSVFAIRRGLSSSILPRFFLHGTEFRVVFSSAEGFGTEFRRFLFRGTAGIPSEISICSVYSVFRGIIFLSEIPNPMCGGSAWPFWSRKQWGNPEKSAYRRYNTKKCIGNKENFVLYFPHFFLTFTKTFKYSIWF